MSLAGLALIVRRLPLGATLALTTMSAVFLLALTSAWLRGLDISCGCFSKEEHKIQTHFPQLFLRDTTLLAAAATLLIAELRRPLPSRQRKQVP